MKTRKIIRRMRQLTDSDSRQQGKQRRAIKDLLKKLRKRSLRLRSLQADAIDEDQRKNLKQELAVLKKQRKKGLKLLDKSRSR